MKSKFAKLQQPLLTLPLMFSKNEIISMQTYEEGPAYISREEWKQYYERMWKALKNKVYFASLFKPPGQAVF